MLATPPPGGVGIMTAEPMGVWVPVEKPGIPTFRNPPWTPTPAAPATRREGP